MDDREKDEEVYARLDRGDGRRTEVKGGSGCLILVWAGAILLLLACAGWVARIWGLI